jgi:hypothetical protein
MSNTHHFLFIQSRNLDFHTHSWSVRRLLWLAYLKGWWSRFVCVTPSGADFAVIEREKQGSHIPSPNPGASVPVFGVGAILLALGEVLWIWKCQPWLCPPRMENRPGEQRCVDIHRACLSLWCSWDVQVGISFPANADWARDGCLTPAGPISSFSGVLKLKWQPQRLVGSTVEAPGDSTEDVFHQLPSLTSPKLVRPRGPALPSVL